jgi:transcription elongation factor GreA
MDTSTIYVTLKGKRILETRLDELVAGREKAADDIRIAREFGDLKENAEYAAAREFQSHLEEEISQIQSQLLNLKVFNYAKVDTSRVNVGCRVKIAEVGGKRVQEWTITGIVESDPSNFFIANEAPLAKSLLGKTVGEVIEIHTPAGAHKYKITDIKCGA